MQVKKGEPDGLPRSLLKRVAFARCWFDVKKKPLHARMKKE